MVEKEIAGDDIEAAGSKRQGDSVAGDSGELLARAVHVREGAVQDCGLKPYFLCEFLTNIQHHVAGPSGHVQ